MIEINQYLPHFHSKNYEIASKEISPISTFQQYQSACPNFPKIFSFDCFEISLKQMFNIQKLLHHKSKH